MTDVVIGVGIALKVPHLQRSATREAPLVGRPLAILGARKRDGIDYSRSSNQFLKLRISRPNQNAAPRLAVSRHIAHKVAEKEVGLSPAAGAAKEKLSAPRRLDCRQLRTALRLPAGLVAQATPLASLWPARRDDALSRRYADADDPAYRATAPADDCATTTMPRWCREGNARYRS